MFYLPGCVILDVGYLRPGVSTDLRSVSSSVALIVSACGQGVKFEPNSFKLNHEMVVLMGGRNSEGYHLFVQLTVKAFLAIRPFTDQIVETVRLMLGTGLSSFKGEGTIQRLRDRFVPGLTERQAAEWMMGVIRNAHENVRSTVYDEFQRVRMLLLNCLSRRTNNPFRFKMVRSALSQPCS